jgi:hypothetical protein
MPAYTPDLLDDDAGHDLDVREALIGHDLEELIGTLGVAERCLPLGVLGELPG